jgi:hypothetical protein
MTRKRKPMMLLCGVLMLCVGSGCYAEASGVIPPVREAWILALPSGPEYKIYTGAAIGGCVALLVTVYAKAAKQVIDTVFVRIGDVVSAAVVFVGAHVLAWPLRAFVSINGATIVLWLVVVRSILKRYQALVSLEQSGPGAG